MLQYASKVHKPLSFLTGTAPAVDWIGAFLSAMVTRSNSQLTRLGTEKPTKVKEPEN